MNQAFPSGEDAQYAIIESRVLGLAEQATRIERALRQLEEGEEEPAELGLPSRCRPLRRRARGAVSHLPKGVKFYVIGGGLGLLGLVFGLPQSHPARVVMTRTVDYFAQQVQVPEVPPSMGLVAMLPGHVIPDLSAAATPQTPTARVRPSPPPTGAQPVASVASSSNNSAASTAATVASSAPVSIATPSIDAGSVVANTAAPTAAPAAAPPPPTVVPTIPNPTPIPIPIPAALPPPPAPVSVPAVADPPPPTPKPKQKETPAPTPSPTPAAPSPTP